jgi:hypothetical protein
MWKPIVQWRPPDSDCDLEQMLTSRSQINLEQKIQRVGRLPFALMFPTDLLVV